MCAFRALNALKFELKRMIQVELYEINVLQWVFSNVNHLVGILMFHLQLIDLNYLYASFFELEFRV